MYLPFVKKEDSNLLYREDFKLRSILKHKGSLLSPKNAFYRKQ